MPKPTRYNPTMWTLELCSRSHTTSFAYPTETEARSALHDWQVALTGATGCQLRLRLWHKHVLFGSFAPWVVPVRSTPAPVRSPDGITRVPPASRAISQFRAYDSPEALGL